MDQNILFLEEERNPYYRQGKRKGRLENKVEDFQDEKGHQSLELRRVWFTSHAV